MAPKLLDYLGRTCCMWEDEDDCLVMIFVFCMFTKKLIDIQYNRGPVLEPRQGTFSHDTVNFV